ncbi:glycosyltransferase [Devosia sp.]|uniref:glycosyltransferase n=1 Tax=Devosia sp. TaxID=1871048 RepID=UPI003A958671
MQPVFTGTLGRINTLGIVVWLICAASFWIWWFRVEHFSGWISFGLVTACIGWLSLNHLYYLIVTVKPLRPVPEAAVPEGLRVAMVVTKAPSEPFDVVRVTLEAMLAQDIVHDTWLADEAPTPETIAWAEAHGVRISTRFGVEDYHHATWPRRTRCKEGNLAYFYDHYGYALYDVVAQLDADHVPEPGYLRAMVQPFADPTVGYVSAPSICDANAASSWSARGRLYAEASMHGTLQAGYNNGWATVCIGSHYAVRTAALKQIGGLGPELAEDHSTTMLMNAAGWRGVHAVDAIAHGLGPETFADLAVQEFQWSRSLVTILLQYTRDYFGALPLRLKFQFLYAQMWYPLSSLTMLLGVAMPILALAFDFTFVNVSYFDFLAHVLPMWAAATLLAFAQRRSGVYRPGNARILSWEGATFACARWPWVVLGTVAALTDFIAGRRTEFRVTPKGQGGATDLPLSVLTPYAVISLASGFAALAISGLDIANGYYLLATFNAAIYGAVFAVILFGHWRENRIVSRGMPRLIRVGAAAMLTVVPVSASAARGLDILDAVAWRSSLRFTETRFTPSGAGTPAQRKLYFKFQWKQDDTP